MNSPRPPSCPAPRPGSPCRIRRAAFSMVELMAVLAIIVILITILIPTVKKVRNTAKVTGAKNQIAQIDSAVQRFYADQGRLPGPLADDQLAAGIRGVGLPNIYDNTGNAKLADEDKITQAENLVLGLYGGLKWVIVGTNPARLCYDPTMVGRGMIGMNPQQPKKSQPYLEDLKMLSPFPGNVKDPNPSRVDGGPFVDGAGTANDSRIPELVDINFNSPMPILVLRARTGAGGIIRNNIANEPPTAADPAQQFNLSDISPYTQGVDPTAGSIGEGKTIRESDYKNAKLMPPGSGVLPHGLSDVDKTKSMNKDDANYCYPYDAWAYFSSPTDPNPVGTRTTPRKKDSLILISAGLDRVYGTADDVTNFGSVLPD